MSTTKVKKRRLVASGAAAALVSAVVAVPTFAAIPPSTFDALNGDFETTAGLTDWVDLTEDEDQTLTSGEWTYQDDAPSGQNDDSFTQGTWEDTEPPVPSTGSVPPNKSDLTRFYVGVENAAQRSRSCTWGGCGCSTPRARRTWTSSSTSPRPSAATV